MKKFITFLSIFSLVSIKVFADCGTGSMEILVCNTTAYPIVMNLYPQSAVMNTFDKYCLAAGRPMPINAQGYNFDYLNGSNTHNSTSSPFAGFTVESGSYEGYNFDGDEGSDNCSGAYGMGIYKLTIYSSYYNQTDSCYIEIDYLSPSTVWGDLRITIRPNGFSNRYTYKFDDYEEQLITYSALDDYYIKIWEPNGVNDVLNKRPKQYGPAGGFLYGNITSNPINPTQIDRFNTYSIFPTDPRIYCDNTKNPYISGFHNQSYPAKLYDYETQIFFFDQKFGILSLNLTLKKNNSSSQPVDINSPFYSWTPLPTASIPPYPAQPTIIDILPNVFLQNAKGASSTSRKFILNKYTDSNLGTNIIVNKNASLILENAENTNIKSQIDVNSFCNILIKRDGNLNMGTHSLMNLRNSTLAEESPDLANGGVLKLDKRSFVTLGALSEINVGPGSKFINCGAFFLRDMNGMVKLFPMEVRSILIILCTALERVQEIQVLSVIQLPLMLKIQKYSLETVPW